MEMEDLNNKSPIAGLLHFKRDRKLNPRSQGHQINDA
jgi:hypothetical protein